MNKRNILKTVNILLAILILNQAMTGIFHDLLPHSVFEFFHEGGGVTLFVMVMAHVYLNWAWVKANLLPDRKKSKK